jgi:hypothetical protein
MRCSANKGSGIANGAGVSLSKGESSRNVIGLLFADAVRYLLCLSNLHCGGFVGVMAEARDKRTSPSLF